MPLLLPVGGMLALLGVVALVGSVVRTGSLRPALACAAGVAIGFNAGFVLLFLVYLCLLRRRP